jgi:DNA mismatch repair protein MSH4
MKHSALPEVLNAILDIFVESTTFSRNAHAMRHQECFALKPKTDGMMDIIRKAFLANVDDIYKLADEYAETYGIKVAVKETTSRGYYLAIPADVVSDLPQVFIQPVKSGKSIHCTTEEVHSLNARAQENVQDLLMMTHERIQEVLDVARSHYDALASLSDAIALLDMCHCFADNVASSRARWCRPIVTSSSIGGELSVLGGRYGIDTSKAGLSLDAGNFVPNDTHASRSRHFTVITGVNGSGKSTYLKQLAIIVVLAHCGSYVPADEARIPVSFLSSRIQQLNLGSIRLTIALADT